MKRTIIPVALVLAAVFASVALAVGDSDVNGPPCADITGGGFTYQASEAPPPVVSGSAQLAAPACRQVTYTLYVLDASGTTLLATKTASPDDFIPSGVRFVAPVPGGGATVCVYAETSIGRHVFDRAPDSGCEPVSSGSGGGSGFR